MKKGFLSNLGLVGEKKEASLGEAHDRERREARMKTGDNGARERGAEGKGWRWKKTGPKTAITMR